MGADDVVLAIGFIPNWADINPEFFGCDEGIELSVRAVGEAIAYSESVFWTNFHGCVGRMFFTAETQRSQRVAEILIFVNDNVSQALMNFLRYLG